MNVILRGIMGSTAYGLAREGSDIDRLGIFVAPTLEVAGLDWSGRRESVVEHDPSDSTHHEIGKYLRLALGCNPTLLELLWLPRTGYEVQSPEGAWLVELREAFLSERGVRNAYGGYAKQQAVKLAKRGDSFSSDTIHRTAKHARHMLRLQRQGRQLLETGSLTVRVDNPEEYWAFDHISVEEMLGVFEREDELFRKTPSVLPGEPRGDVVREYLSRVRRAFI